MKRVFPIRGMYLFLNDPARIARLAAKWSATVSPSAIIHNYHQEFRPELPDYVRSRSVQPGQAS
jgi:hypothetical protein